jgi:hypothetical protein
MQVTKEFLEASRHGDEENLGVVSAIVREGVANPRSDDGHVSGMELDDVIVALDAQLSADNEDDLELAGMTVKACAAVRRQRQSQQREHAARVLSSELDLDSRADFSTSSSRDKSHRPTVVLPASCQVCNCPVPLTRGLELSHRILHADLYAPPCGPPSVRAPTRTTPLTARLLMPPTRIELVHAV